MIVTYTQSEMLARWRRAFGLGTSYIGVDIEEFEGIDTSTTLVDIIRRWYLDQLDTAPLALLPVETLSLTPVKTVRDIMARAELPASVRRVVQVESEQWEVAATPLSATEAAKRIERLATPYDRPGPANPLVVATGQALQIAPYAGSAPLTIRAVCDPGPGTYILDDSLLPTNSLNS